MLQLAQGGRRVPVARPCPSPVKAVEWGFRIIEVRVVGETWLSGWRLGEVGLCGGRADMKLGKQPIDSLTWELKLEVMEMEGKKPERRRERQQRRMGNHVK
ncbi:hypothetical protein LIA77_02862 [Sarocladium implicatum]|nr:hypothetical protein LIA77_02862 [Sarocladium implicatum]